MTIITILKNEKIEFHYGRNNFIDTNDNNTSTIGVYFNLVGIRVWPGFTGAGRYSNKRPIRITAAVLALYSNRSIFFVRKFPPNFFEFLLDLRDSRPAVRRRVYSKVRVRAINSLGFCVT